MPVLDNALETFIRQLLAANTQNMINDLSQLLLSNSDAFMALQESPQYTIFQLQAIALLAVEDAKTTNIPSSANEFYRLVFFEAKRILGNATSPV